MRNLVRCRMAFKESQKESNIKSTLLLLASRPPIGLAASGPLQHRKWLSEVQLPNEDLAASSGRTSGPSALSGNTPCLL